MSSSLLTALRAACAEYWSSDYSRSLSREQLKEVLRALDHSFSDEELDIVFDAADKNQNGRLEYEEFIDFVLSNEQVADLATEELGLLQAAVSGSEQRVAAFSDDEAELAKILEESRKEADSIRMRDEASVQQALEASAAAEAEAAARRVEAARRAEEEEKRFLEATVQEAKQEAERKAREQAAADEAEFEAALKASELAAAEDADRRRKRHEEEDSSDLFRAALRASCLDLGPRGISQAAKVFATGDPTLGQPRAGFDTTTSGARGRRARATVGAAPAFTGKEEAAGMAPVAGRTGSPGAVKRQAEWAARAGGPRTAAGR
eukprot:TRINITY_DN27499_c0_g1_i2.p1 TRINITY_DN27499_c0_g1~~TRINITY_DN27499_c0_g1_i2.p1  ORF type:complete len:321 (-),score=108.67 TRINITY_DN27499_c0_g1_i2:126-1088(-)